MKILFLSRWFPFPANNGSKLRIYNLLRGLSQHHDVTLLSFSDQLDGGPEAADGRSICSDVYIVPWREFNPQSMRAKLGFLNPKPRSLIDTFSPEMARKIVELLSSRQYDLVIASQLPMAAYYQYFKHVPAIFEELEIGLSLEDSHRTLDWKKHLRHAFTWFKLRIYLGRLLDSFQAVTVVSNQERELVLQNLPHVKNVLVIPNCMNMNDYKDIRVEPKPDTLIFTGSFRYHANYEAMQWFVGEVFPLVLKKIPSAELIITGDHASLPLPSVKNVTLTGYVDDVKSLIASSTVALAPLWSGGGTRLKILEAMAIGIPVVATTKGSEGLDVKADEQLFIADEPAKFAACVVRLLSEKDSRHAMIGYGKQLVKEKYDWTVVLPRFFDLVKETALK